MVGLESIYRWCEPGISSWQKLEGVHIARSDLSIGSSLDIYNRIHPQLKQRMKDHQELNTLQLTNMTNKKVSDQKA